MGIRFLCPNGHKLNVKAFLAGKRAICPQCDAKFLVPPASGGQAAPIGTEPAAQPETVAALTPVEPAELVPPPVMSLAGGPPPTVGEQSPPEAWYVRTAAGAQFGPASLEVMRSWVAEARVSVDCWVWRTGWPQWKTGGQAITLLNGPPPEIRTLETPGPETPAPEAPVPQIPAPERPQSPGGAAGSPSETLPAALPEPSNATAQYRSFKHSRRQRARKVTFFLGGVVLLLIAVLVVVLMKNK